MNFDLDAHLKREHHRTALSTYLKEIVYGGNDGIVTTFAVVAGFNGAQSDPAATAIPFISVLLFGIANIFGDGVSMGLGSFISLRANQDLYRSEKQKEQYEITHEPEKEEAETIEILRRKNFDQKDATVIAKLLSKNRSYWTEFMMKDELEMPNPENEKPLIVALFTFFSFIVFGSVPLLPYILFPHLVGTFGISISFTFFALFLLGILRSVITRQKTVRALFETLLVGGTAASVAFFIGTFFRL